MRSYQRFVWLPNQNTGEDVLIRLCPDCGAVVGDVDKHDAWHDVEHVDTYDALPEEGSPTVTYRVKDENAHYEWVVVPDGSSGYYSAVAT